MIRLFQKNLRYKSLSFISILALTLNIGNTQSVRVESITYLNSDGKSYTSYSNLKSGYLNIYSYLPKGETPLDYYQYLYPNEYELIPTHDKNFDRVNFIGGEYAMIINDVFDDSVLNIDENGIYTYKIAKTKVNNHYGLFWESPNDSGFTELVYVWIIPDEFEFVSYQSNRAGNWVERSNSISYFANNTNDVLIEISYKKKSLTPDFLSKRKVEVKDSINVASEKISLKVRDNGKEDGDIISINLNGEWIAKGLKVTKNIIELELSLRKGNNYLIMYAENEGNIPPNTAALEIEGQSILLNSSAKSSEAIEVFVE